MIVIAGATGKTGGAAAQALLAAGRQVRVLVRDAARAESLRDRGAQTVVASLDDPEALVRALEGATALYALVPENPATASFHAEARHKVDAIAAAVRECGVSHVVLLSACTAVIADGNGPWKPLRHAEQTLRAAAPNVTILRAAFFHENVLAGLVPARHDGIYPNFFPDAGVAFPTVATRDVGRIAARLLAEPPPHSQVIDVLGPAYSVDDMAAALGRALGKHLHVVDVPAAEHVGMLVGAGMSPSYAETVAEMFARFAPAKVTPQGDRAERGTTTLDEVLAHALAR